MNTTLSVNSIVTNGEGHPLCHAGTECLIL